MLPYFVHGKGTVNAGYDSPRAAGKADWMFRPLIEGENGTFVAPTASTIGPACYEAVAAAMREALPPDTVSDLVGNGYGAVRRCAVTLFQTATHSRRPEIQRRQGD